MFELSCRKVFSISNLSTICLVIGYEPNEVMIFQEQRPRERLEKVIRVYVWTTGTSLGQVQCNYDDAFDLVTQSKDPTQKG